MCIRDSINALLTPTEGVIWVDGMDVLDEDNTMPIRKTAGMVFQNPDNQIIASVVEMCIRDRLLVMPFPNNPTGAVMEKKDLEAVAEVVKKHYQQPAKSNTPHGSAPQ